MFRFSTPNIITAHKLASCGHCTMKDVVPTYEKYLTFCKDIIPYLVRLEEAMAMATRIVNKIIGLRRPRCYCIIKCY